MNNYPGDVTALTVDQILTHYSRTGLKPTNRSAMNAMIREQHLYAKETYAFYADLVKRGKITDDGKLPLLEEACRNLEECVNKLNASDYS